MPPIKRHAALVAFSRHHHNDLMLTWKIKQGISKRISPDRIVAYLLSAWENELQPNLIFEEEKLFPYCGQLKEQIARAMAEHDQIRQFFEGMATLSGYDSLSAFSAQLNAHTRFEERELFNSIQDSLSEDTLAMIEQSVTQATACIQAQWSDQFWLRSVE